MMVDFRARVLQNSGFDTWEQYIDNQKKVMLKEHHVIEEIEIDGWRNKVSEKVPCWVCELHGEKRFRIAKGHGVTGWEEWGIDHLQKYWLEGDSFCACAGTPGGHQELLLDINQVKSVIHRY